MKKKTLTFSSCMHGGAWGASHLPQARKGETGSGGCLVVTTAAGQWWCSGVAVIAVVQRERES